MIMFNGISLSLSWLVAMIVLLIVEGIAPGLVSIWFAVGALAAMVASLLNASFPVQLVSFVVVSFASLCLTRPLVKKYINAKVQPTNADALIGKKCVVTEDICNLTSTGAVKISGQVWSARAENDEFSYKAGQVVTVCRIEGVKLIVK